MQLIRGIHNLRPQHRGCVATIGNFDGVHLGHQAILRQVKSVAGVHGLPATVIVFEPQPREFFAGAQAPPRLNRFREKVAALREYGADRVVCLQFNPALRELTGEAFVEQVLINGLGVRHLVVGDDFRFGCDRRGDFRLLNQMGQDGGFEVENTHTYCLNGERISSTRVRTTLASGNLRDAARLLGRPYSIASRVVHGRKLGRTIGAPTANLLLKVHRPALNGVFTVMVRLPDGRRWPGVANIGVRPTVDGVAPALEVHLLDFSGDLYAARLPVTFLARLREEHKFDSIDALKAQIALDIQQARSMFQDQAGTGWTPGQAWPDDVALDALLASAPCRH